MPMLRFFGGGRLENRRDRAVPIKGRPALYFALILSAMAGREEIWALQPCRCDQRSGATAAPVAADS
jgi:hypothetical protein